jgi:LPS export ABC transporter protein LptC
MFTPKANYILRCLFLMVALFCIASCENNMNTVSLITSQDKNLQDVEDNASIFYTDSAKTKFHLTAPRIENYEGPDPHQLFPKGISVDSYDDSGHVDGHLDAEYAIRHINSKLMEADNNVRVLNRKGERLNTEQLFWDENKQKIYTNKFVTIKTAREILYGNGLISNEDFTQYKITNLTGTIQVDNPGDNNKTNKK